MSKVKNPQEKKRLSLALDRRNAYGENHKSSRKNIPKAKARGHRAERRVVAGILSHPVSHDSDFLLEEQAETMEHAVHCAAKRQYLRGFVKWPDRPLAEDVARKLERRKRLGSAERRRAGDE